MDLAAAVSIPAAFALLAGILFATRSPDPLSALFAIQLGYNLLMVAGLSAALYAATRPAPDATPDEAPLDLSLRRVLGLGSWIQLISLFALAQNNLDKLLLGALVTLARVGEYEIAWRASYLAYLLPIFFLSALLPAAAAREATHGPEARNAFYRRALEPYLWCVIALTTLLIALAPALLEAWIGRAPEGAIFMLRCVAVAQAGSLATGIASTAARAGDRAGLESAYVGLAVLLHLALSYAGFLAWGWPGIPAGFAVAAVACGAGFVARVDRWLGLRPLAETVRIALPALGVCSAAGLAAMAIASIPFGLAAGRANGLLHLAAGGMTFALVAWIVVATLLPQQRRVLEDRLKSLVHA
jgi:O-antigen/teichoic acid export membrane protein